MSEFVDDGIGREVHEASEPAESGRPDKPYTALSEIRQLVEGFYDIQHLRVETYNRIVAYIRQNSADIIVFLRGRSQASGETQLTPASQSISETQTVCASHSDSETHTKKASQNPTETLEGSASHPLAETHGRYASPPPDETHRKTASQPMAETHRRSASQPSIETQTTVASHDRSETQLERAIKFLEGKEYSKFVDMMLAASASDAPSGKPRRGRKPKSRYMNETQGTGASHSEFETHSGLASQMKTETHAQVASHDTCATPTSTMRQPVNVPFAELIKPITSEIDNLLWFYNHMLRVEIELGKRLDLWSMHHPLRVKFLSRVYGIGGIFSSGIIAWLDEPILQSDYVSSLWRYCGLTPDSKRVAGKKTDYDVKLKTFCWKISTSFIKFDCFGRELYLQFKRDVKHKHPEPVQAKDERGNLLFYRRSGEPKMLWTPKHLDMYARRKTVKMFLSAVWEVWRGMNGRPVETIYPIAYLGHKHHIPFEKWMEKRPAEDV